MQKAPIILAAALALSGCSTMQERNQQPPTRLTVSAAQTVSQPVASPSTTRNEMLRPGPNYVASFPEADRRAACERLNYQAGTRNFLRCLQGDFPENPYFSGR